MRSRRLGRVGTWDKRNATGNGKATGSDRSRTTLHDTYDYDLRFYEE